MRDDSIIYPTVHREAARTHRKKRRYTMTPEERVSQHERMSNAERQRRWRESHPDAARAQQAKSYAKNRDRRIKQQSAYRKKKRQKERELPPYGE